MSIHHFGGVPSEHTTVITIIAATIQRTQLVCAPKKESSVSAPSLHVQQRQRMRRMTRRQETQTSSKHAHRFVDTQRNCTRKKIKQHNEHTTTGVRRARGALARSCRSTARFTPPSQRSDWLHHPPRAPRSLTTTQRLSTHKSSHQRWSDG